jgi:hypothetical protein
MGRKKNVMKLLDQGEQHKACHLNAATSIMRPGIFGQEWKKVEKDHPETM